MDREEEIVAVVRQFVQDLGQDPRKIVMDANLDDLGIDSLHAVGLVFRFEEKFEIDIPLQNFTAKTVGDAVQYILALLQDNDNLSPLVV